MLKSKNMNKNNSLDGWKYLAKYSSIDYNKIKSKLDNLNFDIDNILNYDYDNFGGINRLTIFIHDINKLNNAVGYEYQLSFLIMDGYPVEVNRNRVNLDENGIPVFNSIYNKNKANELFEVLKNSI